MQAGQQVRDFGTTRDGQVIKSIDIGQGVLSARILTYGATLQDLRLQKCGHPLILGWPKIGSYEDSTAYLGAMVGRCANRIARATYSLDGATYQLDRNYLGTHTLHGGAWGTDRMVWDITSVTSEAVTLKLNLPDGHMGFGGDLAVTVTYRIEAEATLSVEMEGRTTSASLCNLTPHIYFDLDGGSDIRKHELTIHADRFTAVDDDLIPTGDTLSVGGTPLDLRLPRPLGDWAYDHNFCLSENRMPCRPVATLTSPSGLSMKLETTEPGLQVYSGASLDEGLRSGLGGQPYGPFSGVALEPQVWPDSINQKGFPNAVLRSGETYRHVSRYVFQGEV
ncbi:aldose epimerase family protein [Ruegeria atlantica]|uniref:aldose epimerase family protein n=1 Tax=Ruegeria atlantica TaxID=81569 RepID=UPI0014799CEB|nr:aldose epimerase family protein [Ruegeria atlantica]